MVPCRIERAHLTAVDEAVVVCEGHIHHRPGLDFAIDDHGPLLDTVHAEDGGLGGVDDWRGQQGAVHAAVADGEGPPGHLINAQGAVLRLLTQGHDLLKPFTEDVNIFTLRPYSPNKKTPCF